MSKNTKETLFWIFMAACLINFLLTFPGCKEVKYIERHHYDTLYIGHNSTDTIKIKDSIHIFRKNDTIYQDRWHFEYIYKDKTDTVYKNKVDTLKVPVIDQKVVITNELKWWQKVLCWTGFIFLVFVAVKLLKRLKA